MTAWKITLLATQWLLLSAQTLPEPIYNPRPLTPAYVEWLRSVYWLPPEEFDHEYKDGPLKVIRGTQSEVREGCRNAFRPNAPAIGCAMRYPTSCVIYILNDSGLQSLNWDFEIVLRHERAHCNGWHHPQL